MYRLILMSEESRERESAEKMALIQVQKLLSEPSQLQSLNILREEYSQKLIAVETQLEAGHEAQLDEMQVG